MPSVQTPVILRHYIKCCKIIRQAVKEVKQQHKTTLIARYNKNIITTWNINQERGEKSTFSGTSSHFTCGWWKIKGSNKHG
jgi:hypothetical protein